MTDEQVQQMLRLMGDEMKEMHARTVAFGVPSDRQLMESLRQWIRIVARVEAELPVN